MMILLIISRNSFASVSNIQGDEILRSYKTLIRHNSKVSTDDAGYFEKINQSVMTIKKCISDESKVIQENFDGDFAVKVTTHSDGLVKNVEVLNSDAMPRNLKSCFLGGLSRIVFPSSETGLETVMVQKFKMSLGAGYSRNESRINLQLQGNTSKLISRF